jgi:capsid protein
MPILDQHGAPIRSAQAEVRRMRGQINRLRARYDAAQTYGGNQRHWANADRLSPDAANSYSVRQSLRSRARYEVVENNSYLKGMLLTKVNDLVGTGPKLQITDPRISTERAQMIEQRYTAWCRAVKLRRIVWQMAMAKIVDGEAFAIEATNPRLPGPVKMDLRVIEADQCTTQAAGIAQDRDSEVDGIKFDLYDNPQKYYILRNHPGAQFWFGESAKTGQWIPAHSVRHWFRRDRPWKRGIPELTPSLPLCALLRRYTLAVVQAAEVAADFAGVLESNGPPNTDIWASTDGTVEDDPFDSIPLDKGMFTTLPWGYQLKQMKAEQPTTVYDKFVDALLKEIARPLLMPFNMASGNSGGYNFASGTLDRQLYQNAIREERLSCEEDLLEPTFESWWWEASREKDVIGQSAGDPPMHTWRWDWMPDHADPSKSVEAMCMAWDYGHITDEQIQNERYARDPESHRQAVQRQREARESVGLPLPSAGGSMMAAGAVSDSEEDESETL